MRDYWLTQYFLQVIGWGYFALTVLALVVAVWLPKQRWAKVAGAVGVLALASVLPLQGYKEYEQDKQAAQDFKLRQAKARALFEERCKMAEEKIYKTIDGVEGVLLMKVRSEKINFSDQYAMDDPFGADCHGDECIKDLLRVDSGKELNPDLSAKLRDGFPWVDAVDANGTRYRYVGVIRPDQPHRLNLMRTNAPKEMPRYGVIWEDISTQLDRDSWIAGGVLKIIDVPSGVVLGERRGYMMDREQGNTSGERSPWAFAYDNACPKFPTVADGRAIRVGHTRKFVLSVVKPAGEK